MGSSSEVKSVDPCILIERSMFFQRVVVRMGNGIFCGLVNIYNGGGSWWSTRHCCEKFWLNRCNLEGDEKGGGGGKFFGWLGTLQRNSTLEKNDAK